MPSNPDLPMSLPWEETLERLCWDAKGLIPVTTVDVDTGIVLMAAWVNKEALVKTFESQLATYWSRSRNELWTKGESSGHVQHLHEVRVDCDGDVILYLVKPTGPSCHTGRASCFSWHLSLENGLTCDRPIMQEATE